MLMMGGGGIQSYKFFIYINYCTVDYPVSHAMMKWYTEKPNYDFATQTCASGKICGHYTQVSSHIEFFGN